MPNFDKSNEYQSRAEKVIPLGSQTFSKSITHYPRGVSPTCITHGKGCYVWDVDGNKYIDWVSGLLSVSLGYCDSYVDEAISRQLKQGINFSLPHSIESEVAELLIKHVPCAEMVRFAKNGSDATSFAIRIARAYTGKEQIISLGYHGWNDWYIAATTRNKGIPVSQTELNHKLPWGDLQALENHLVSHESIAALIMEPMTNVFPEDGYLQGVRSLCNQYNVVLVFDETITGLRFSLGGAQKLFSVKPDLATFGKGIANGMPLSVLVGKRELMQEFEEVFLSGTFSGETLSLAAAKAVLEKSEKIDLPNYLYHLGTFLMHKFNALVRKENLGELVSISGHPCWSFLNFKSTHDSTLMEIKTYFLQEMIAKGHLIQGTHNLTGAHSEQEIDHLISDYSEILPKLRNHLKDGSLRSEIKSDLLEPLFKVR